MRRSSSLNHLARKFRGIAVFFRYCYSFFVKNIKISSTAVLGIAVFAITISVVAQPVSALLSDKYPIANKSLGERAKSTMLVYAVSRCIKNEARLSGGVAGNLISEANVISGDWFNIHNTEDDDRTDPSFLVTSSYSKDGRVNCTDALKAGILAWGYSDGLDLICEFVEKRGNGSSCKTGDGGFGSTSGLGFSQHRPFNSEDYTKFQAAIKKKLYASSMSSSESVDFETPLENGAGWYLVYKAALTTGCSARPSSTASEDFKYTITEVDPETRVVKSATYEGKRRNTEVYAYTNKSLSGVKLSCAEVADRMNAYAEEYKAYVDDYFLLFGKADIDPGTGSQPCSGDSNDPTCASRSSCGVEGVGWIICPVINFMAAISDGAFSVITYFLEIRAPLLDVNNGTSTAWKAFRDIANVAFVVVFLIIIFSQLTGLGVTNYGVKKTLPRLIIAAVLVNISFFICQLAVDITQIIGSSIQQFLSSVAVTPASGSTPPPSGWVEVMGDILASAGVAVIAGAAVTGIAATVALSISSAVLLAFLVAVLMTVVILIGRQAAIVILIVLSPLAFVAYLLPNTESWFKKWYKTFWGLLLVYPIIGLLYGGGAMVAKILSNVAAGATDVDRLWLGIIALGVSAVPLILTPMLLKGAMGATGTLGAKLSGFANKANSRIGRSAMTGSRLGEVKQGLRNRTALRRANSRSHSNFQRAVDQSSLGKALGLDKGTARALNAIDEEENKEVTAAVAQISHDTTSVNRIGESARILKESIISGDKTKARAAQRILLSSGNAGVSALQDVYSGKHGSTDEEVDLTKTALSSLASTERSELTGYLRSEVNSAGLKGRNNALARWGYEGPADALANGYSKAVKDEAGNITGTERVEPFAKDIATFEKLSSVELAQQSIDNLESGAGNISAKAAQAVLNNAEAAAALDPIKRQIFEDISRSGIDTHVVVNQGTQNQQTIPRSASEIHADITAAGGTTSLSNEELLRVHHHAVDTISKADPGRAALKSDTSAEIADRGIVYDKKAMRK